MINKIPFKVEESDDIKNKYRVILEGDVNDADYVYTINTYDKEEFEEEIAYGLAFALDHLNEDIEDDELWDNTLVKPEGAEEFFEVAVSELCDIPSNEYGTCHTLESVEVYYYDDDCKCYKIDNESIKDACKYECDIVEW